MSIFKDFAEDVSGYRYRKQAQELIDPRTWLHLHRWRRQRADRGWSDRDTWGAGEHIAKMTAEMLQQLNDHTYVDWPMWVKLNVKEEGKGAYKNLQSVIDDINKYLDHQETSWADGLTTVNDEIEKVFTKREDGNYGYHSPDWVDLQTGKKVTQAAITHRIHKWAAEDRNLYKKAQKAMGFFSRHFAGFWD